MSTLLNWPADLERTPEHKRENTTKFSAGYSRTKRDIRGEMERLEVDNYRLDDVTGSGGDPGVVLRWTADGQEHAVACDAYTAKRDNLREIYLWIKETRMSGDRPVATVRDQFAAAALPSGDDVEAVAPPPHEVLGVRPDAPENVIKAAAKAMKKQTHPDSPDGDREAFQRVNEAEEEMLNG